ncbi:hypothetical protein TNCT_639461 [Trichonephila clavata]|uniref:Uncharacterized protein n=1 Tax=Trichonephila clavata TaxID=2740835 RepID=A0A8X6KYQ0_TRICU|nr:hypothetical protein TNCT_639461 [Trichonephila clavata]
MGTIRSNYALYAGDCVNNKDERNIARRIFAILRLIDSLKYSKIYGLHLYSLDLSFPLSQKSIEVRSGDRVGHENGKRRDMTQSQKFFSKTLRTDILCGDTPSCIQTMSFSAFRCLIFGVP